MLSRAFENIRRKNPGLERELQKLQDYIKDQTKGGVDEIVPPLAAEALNLSNLATLGLLVALEDNHALKHKYRVYCKNHDAVLLELDNKDQLPEELYCQYCDSTHDEDDLDIEVIFKIEPGIQEQIEKSAEVV